MTIVKLVLLTLLLTDIYAVSVEQCNTTPGEEKRERCEIVSEESGHQDDEKTNTTCPIGYSIVDCVLVQVANCCHGKNTTE